MKADSGGGINDEGQAHLKRTVDGANETARDFDRAMKRVQGAAGMSPEKVAELARRLKEMGR